MMARWALRPELLMRNLPEIRPTRQSMVGSSVIFSIQSDLAAATSTLSETTDVDAVALSNSQVTVTLAEYGNAVNTSALVRGTSFLTIDNLVANAIGFNAGISHDTLVRNVVQAGTNVRYMSTAVSRVTVGAAMTLNAAMVRRTRSELVGAFVAKNAGAFYQAYIHPDVTYDLRGETGAAAWRDPHTYSQPDEIWTGEMGEFESFRWIETPRAPLFADAGVGGTVDVYATIFTGSEAMAEAYSTADGNSPEPRIILGPVVDKLRRLVPVGWYMLHGWSRFREAAIRRVESSSSIGANT